MTVVVGVDGSMAALNAVRAAALEAGRRDTPLRIVHAFVWPLLYLAPDPVHTNGARGPARHAAERLLARAVAVADAANPALKVEADLVTGTPANVLCAAGEAADLLVLGASGPVVTAVADRTCVPLLMVRGEARSSGPVVVGLDGTPGSAAALRAAFDECERRTCGLVAVHVHSPAENDGLPASLYERDAAFAEDDRLFVAALDARRRRHPNVPVASESYTGDPAHELVERAEDAQLLVVGTHGRGVFTGIPLGAVSRWVMHHADCPVLLVPHGERVRDRIGAPLSEMFAHNRIRHLADL